jgi:hypothetical protein
MADWVSNKRLAASVKLPVAQSASKASSCLVSNGRILFIGHLIAFVDPHFEKI